MNKYFFISLVAALFIFASPGYAQKDTVINGRRYKAMDSKPAIIKKGKRLTPLDSQFVIDNKRFQYYNNWINIGLGAQQNLTYGIGLGFAGSADFNFHIKRSYFQAGAMLTGEKIQSYNNYQVHLCYGTRFEDNDVHVAGFAGISYSSGYGRDTDSTYNRRYLEPGIYAEAEIVKKISYDIGLGGSLFADWNKEQSMIGARFVLYFSGAFIGKEKSSSEN
ncbi:MAG TPA: hypothetical protein VFF27_11945 [Bacteroidia bacterium]|nr:hypothetical protein [Bacteroidia bacterium]